MKGYSLVHGLADCQTCGWNEGDYKIAARKGREHANKTGHTVRIELGFHKQISTTHYKELK